MNSALSLAKKTSTVLVLLWTSLVLVFNTGCASGGYKITRAYAGFVNKQHIIIRIVLYLLTTVVFAVTLLIDMVIFNTMDFWQGRVSQGDYTFEKDGRQYAVKHEIRPNQLKKSTILVRENNTLLQTVELIESANHEISMYVDGQLTGRASDINNLPQITYFDSKGAIVDSMTMTPDREFAYNYKK